MFLSSVFVLLMFKIKLPRYYRQGWFNESGTRSKTGDQSRPGESTGAGEEERGRERLELKNWACRNHPSSTRNTPGAENTADCRDMESAGCRPGADLLELLAAGGHLHADRNAAGRLQGSGQQRRRGRVGGGGQACRGWGRWVPSPGTALSRGTKVAALMPPNNHLSLQPISSVFTCFSSSLNYWFPNFAAHWNHLGT